MCVSVSVSVCVSVCVFVSDSLVSFKDCRVCVCLRVFLGSPRARQGLPAQQLGWCFDSFLAPVDVRVYVCVCARRSRAGEWN